jgi:hypothetical protein
MMSNQNLTAGLLVGAAALAIMAATPVFAVQTNVDGYFYDLPAGSDKNLAAVRALIAASDALGMTRRGGSCLANSNCLGTTTASHEYRATGTWMGQKVDLVVVDFDYRIPAIRVDVTTPDKKRSGKVAAEDLVWDESSPGYFSGTSTEKPADRLLPIYLLPHAVAYFGGLAADKIKLATSATGDRTLTIPLPAPISADLVAHLGVDGLPDRTELTYGGKIYTGEFSDFSNDRMDYHVFGPNSIVIKADGNPIIDLDVEWHWTNPYMVFPTPKQLGGTFDPPKA